MSLAMAVGSGDYVATVVDMEGYHPVLRVMRSRAVRCVAYHPALPYLALGDGGNSVSIIDLLGEELVTEVSLEARVNTLAFSPLGDFLVVGTDDCSFTMHETQVRHAQEIALWPAIFAHASCDGRVTKLFKKSRRKDLLRPLHSAEFPASILL